MPAERIDPWASEKYDYARLIEEFGIEVFDLERFPLPDPSHMLRRGVIFGHRGFGPVHRAITRKDPFAVLTGLAPSGRMHFGHKMVVDQFIYYHGQGADVTVAVADFEAWGARGVPLDECRKVAIEEYIINYIALGLPLERTQIYFQSGRKDVEDMTFILSKPINMSKMRAVYGFTDETSMSHILSPLVQMGDIIHVQMDKYGGPRPTIVPVGVDQDPHIRLSRDVANWFRVYSVQKAEDRTGVFLKGDAPIELLDTAGKAVKMAGHSVEYNRPYRALYTDMSVEDADSLLLPLEHEEGYPGYYPPGATYNMLMTGLSGGKMSSSQPDTAIFLSDSPEEAKKKLGSAFTGGAVSAEEQRRDGGKPDICTIFEMMSFHLVPDDKELEVVRTECLAGDRLCGHCKKEATEMLTEFLTDLSEKREQARELVDEYIQN